MAPEQVAGAGSQVFSITWQGPDISIDANDVWPPVITTETRAGERSHGVPSPQPIAADASQSIANDTPARMAAQTSLGSASAIRRTPSSTFFIEVAYDRRTKPGAWNAEPMTTATRAASISHSHS